MGHIHGFEYVYVEKHVTVFTLELPVLRSCTAYKQGATKADLD